MTDHNQRGECPERGLAFGSSAPADIGRVSPRPTRGCLGQVWTLIGVVLLGMVVTFLLSLACSWVLIARGYSLAEYTWYTSKSSWELAFRYALANTLLSVGLSFLLYGVFLWNRPILPAVGCGILGAAAGFAVGAALGDADLAVILGASATAIVLLLLEFVRKLRCRNSITEAD